MSEEKLLKAINGMIISIDNNPKKGDWIREFLVEIKAIIEGQREDLDMYRSYLDREKNRSYLLEEEIKRHKEKVEV